MMTSATPTAITNDTPTKYKYADSVSLETKFQLNKLEFYVSMSMYYDFI